MQPLSAHNQHVVRLGRLARQRRFRESEGLFVVDGPVLLAEAVKAGLTVDEVFVDVDRVDGRTQTLIDEVTRLGARIFTIDVATQRRSTDPVTPQAITAVVRRPTSGLSMLRAAEFVLVLVGIQDPGNAGTLMRAATASGAQAVIVTSGTVDLFAPKTVRASAGAVFRLPVIDGGEVSDVLGHVADAGLDRVAAVPERGVPYDEANLSGRVAIFVGNEAHGFEASTESTVDRLVHIPMPGPTESLNVAMAGTLLCFEVNRQRRAAAASTQLDVDARITGC